MAASSMFKISHFRSRLSRLPSASRIGHSRLRSVSFVLACLILVSASAVAQKKKPEPTLVPGSEVSLSAVNAADWVQGAGPTAFEPGKIYMFECWATWCGPCVGMIPHVNELHKKYYDQGLRVYGMNCWEDGKPDVQKFVEKKGAGMSYPVAYTGEGSPFETEWLTAAAVPAIPYAFIVRNGKLLLSTEASRLTDKLVEEMLSGEEGAKKAAAEIQSVHDSREQTDALLSDMYSAYNKRDAKKMAAIIEEIESLDRNHPDLPQLKLKLLIANEQWPTAITALNELPEGESRKSFLVTTGIHMGPREWQGFSEEFNKAIMVHYAKTISDGGKSMGPNHYVSLSFLQWKTGDEQAAAATASQGFEAVKNFPRISKYQAEVYQRFAESVKSGTMPKYDEVKSWLREASRKTAAAKKAAAAK